MKEPTKGTLSFTAHCPICGLPLSECDGSLHAVLISSRLKTLERSVLALGVSLLFVACMFLFSSILRV